MEVGVGIEKANAKCPQCGELMANMGLDFESPKKSDIKAWNHLRDLYSVGITFHSCGCSGPGYIPKDKSALIEHFEELLQGFQANLKFWQRENGAKSKEEVAERFTRMPIMPKTDDGAKLYWIDKIADVNSKLVQIRKVK